MKYTIENQYYSITVDTLGAELISLKDASGYEHLWQNKPDFWNRHAPLLFPICGKLKDSKYTYGGKTYNMKGHGFIGECEFELKKCGDGHITMAFSSNEQTKEIYPFDFSVIADYELAGERVNFSFTVNNEGEETLPYMFGWHPAFTLPCDGGQDINDYKLYFGDIKKLEWHPLQNGPFARPLSVEYPIENGAYQLNEKEIYENDTMIFLGHGNRLTMSADGHPYKLYIEWSENLPNLCIWKWPDNAAKFICIEPWSKRPNDGVTPEDFETRTMDRLEKKNSAVYSYSLEVKKS